MVSHYKTKNLRNYRETVLQNKNMSDNKCNSKNNIMLSKKKVLADILDTI